MEDTGSFGEFISAVPRPDNVLHTWVEGTFRETCRQVFSKHRYTIQGPAGAKEHTDKEPQHVELRRRVASRQGKRQDSPEKLHGWNPVPGPHSSQEDVTGYLANYIAHGPACLDVVELVLIHAQVFFPVDGQSICAC